MKERFGRFVAQPGVRAVDLTWPAACGAYGLSPLEHRDPADRMLTATAIEWAGPLVTYDTRIADFCAAHGPAHGLRVAA